MSNDRFSPLNEVLPELAGAHEAAGLHEYEVESEAESEAEAFFDRLASLASAGGISPALQRLAAAAAESAVAGLHEAAGGSLHEMEMEDEMEVSPLARVYADLAGVGGLNPISRIYPEALMEMEHLGHIAAEAPTLAEAEAHARRIVPVAVRVVPVVAHRAAHTVSRPTHVVVPRAVHAVKKAAPALAHGITGVTRALHRNPATRHLIRAVPTILRATTNQLVQQAAHGRPLTPQAAVHALARQAARVVGNPAHSVQAWRRSRALDKRYHRALGVGTPGTWMPGMGMPRPSPTTWVPGMPRPRPVVPGTWSSGLGAPGPWAPGLGRPRMRKSGGCGCGGCCGGCGCHRCRSGH
jgi:hypothetical protein